MFDKDEQNEFKDFLLKNQVQRWCVLWIGILWVGIPLSFFAHDLYRNPNEIDLTDVILKFIAVFAGVAFICMFIRWNEFFKCNEIEQRLDEPQQSQYPLYDTMLSELDDDFCIGVGGMMCDHLHEILETMDVPENRKNDPDWLLRNLGIRNRNHPDFEKAMSIINALHPHKPEL